MIVATAGHIDHGKMALLESAGLSPGAEGLALTEALVRFHHTAG